jgi:branched-chain amino acid transport system ATP-binding protein
MNAGSNLLVARELTKRFGGLVAIDSLSLEVRRNEILGLIGPNGSGKTTFFNVITGLYASDSGETLFDGHDISKLPAQAVYRAGIARTFQRSRLSLPLSIFDNIMVGNHMHLDQGLWFNLGQRRVFKRQLEEQFERARQLVQIFDPPLADRMFEPVGGFPMIDRRRIEICRALISQPKLLLLDEPSAGMTHEETTQLMDDILEVKERFTDLTVIIIEHEMGVIERITNDCVVLNFGRKICQGSFQDVAADELVQEAYLGIR